MIISDVSTDESLVTEAALDYVEGWFEGDAERMERAVHPELVKRTLRDGRLEALTARQMIEATASGKGKRPADERAIEITVEHVGEGVANATVLSAPFVDYLQLARTDDGWKIVNVLWRLRLRRQPARPRRRRPSTRPSGCSSTSATAGSRPGASPRRRA